MKNKLLKFLALAFTCVSLSAFAVACGGGDLGNGTSSPSSESLSSETSSAVNSGLSFKTLTVDGLNVNGKFPNATEEFSFVNEITLSGDSTFQVSKDKYGTETYLTKIVPLKEGNNVYYIFEMNGTDVLNTYTVTLRRKGMYTVSFNTQGGTQIPPQQVEEDDLVTMPDSTPERAGYTFVDWNFDFATPITKNITIKPNWEICEEGVFISDGETITGLLTVGKQLQSLAIPESINGITITTIGANAFSGSDMVSVAIPDSITIIESLAFENCTNLTDVYYNGTATQWADVDVETFAFTAFVSVHYKDGTRDRDWYNNWHTRASSLEIVAIDMGLGVDWLKSSVQAFNRKYGTNVTVVGDEYLANNINELVTSSKKNADMYFTFSTERQWVEWYCNGNIYDLSDIEDEIVYRNTEYAKLGRYDDKRIIMPYVYAPTGFVYNQELLDIIPSYGEYTRGQFPTTWQGLIDMCEAINEDGTYIPFSYGGLVGDLDYIVKALWAQIDPVGYKAWLNQPALENIDNNQNKGLLINDGLTLAMQKVVELLNPTKTKQGQYIPYNSFATAINMSNLEAQQQFLNGNCVFTISGAWFENEMRNQIEEDNISFYHFAPAPKVSSDKQSTVFINTPSEYFVVPKNGKNDNVELAKFFLQYMAEEAQAQNFHKKTGTPCAMEYTAPSGLTTFQKEVSNAVKNSASVFGGSDSIPSLSGLVKVNFNGIFRVLATSAPSNSLIVAQLESWYESLKRQWANNIGVFIN